MNHNQKYSFVYNLYDTPNEKEYERNKDFISRLSKDRSPVIRGATAKLAANFNDGFMRSILLGLSFDRNKIVRLEATDSLRFFSDDEVYERLVALSNDPYYLVRGYAIYGIGIIGNGLSKGDFSVRLIEKKLKSERRRFNKIFCYEALYYLGNTKILDLLLSLYPHLIYTDKCAVINFMIEIINLNNRDTIIPFFEKELDNVTECSVKSLIGILLDTALGCENCFDN